MYSDPSWAYNPMSEYATMGPLSTPSAEPYQKRIQELADEGNVLRYEINELKSKYSGACSSYNHVAEELEKLRQQEAGMINTLHLFQGEKERLENELAWVMREAIPRMVVRVLQSEEFDREMLKVQAVMVEQGRQLGRREAQDLSLSISSDGGHIDVDPSMMEMIAQAVSGLKKESWAVMDDVTKAPELSCALLRYVLRHGGGGEGPSHVA